jgi:hypothetical protein
MTTPVLGVQPELVERLAWRCLQAYESLASALGDIGVQEEVAPFCNGDLVSQLSAAIAQKLQ